MELALGTGGGPGATKGTAAWGRLHRQPRCSASPAAADLCPKSYCKNERDGTIMLTSLATALKWN